VLKRIEADAAETRFEVGDIHTRLISQEFIIEGIRKAN
jgi:hypothetical protein